MQNKNSSLATLGVIAIASMGVVSCVNPPQRASGVNPSPAKNPLPGIEKGDGLESETSPTGDDSRGERSPGRAIPVVPAPAPGAGAVKVSYWLNTTDNSNCLTVQVAGSASAITAPCTGGGRTSPQWIEQTFPSSGVSAFKAVLKVETTDRTQAKAITSSDNLGDAAWRWRCVTSQDSVSKTFIHTACYEDGNILEKSFESSDLFVQISGPEGVDLGGIQCAKGTSVDLVRCVAK